MSPALVKSVKEAATAGQAQQQQENEQARAMLLAFRVHFKIKLHFSVCS